MQKTVAVFLFCFVSFFFFVFLFVCMSVLVSTWLAVLFTLLSRDLELLSCPHCPLRKMLLLPAKRNLNHHHHIYILVCVTRAKTCWRQAAFKKYMTWELHTAFHSLLPLVRTQSHGHIYLHLRPGDVGCPVFKRKRRMSVGRWPASSMWIILIYSSSIVC